MKDYRLYWERCWQEEGIAELYRYLDMYYGIKTEEIAVFQEVHFPPASRERSDRQRDLRWRSAGAGKKLPPPGACR